MKPLVSTAIVAVAAGRLVGQEPIARPAFEVAVIKPAGPFSLDRMFAGQVHTGSIKGQEATFQFVSLTDLLTYAYRVKPYQISGPAWMGDGRWDINAKLPDGGLAAAVPEMILSLMIDRFKLAAHHESRENPAYELVVDKGGPKFKPSPPEDDSTDAKSAAGADTASSFSLGGFPGGQGNMNFGSGGRGVITGGPNGTTRVSQNPNGGIRLEMSRMAMASLADMLTAFVERPVIDGTVLIGKYQIGLDLPFASMLQVIQNLGGNGAFQSGFPGFPGGGLGGFPGGPGGPGAPAAGAASDPTASVFQAVQQLGLKLQSRKAPVDTIVIDHLEKTPVEN